MPSKGTLLAAAFLVASLGFAWWAHTQRARTAPPPAPAVAADGGPHAEERGPERIATPPVIRPPGGYSIDARPNTVLGWIDLGARVDAQRQVLPEIELRHASGRRVRAPVTASGFFGAGALDDGTWTVRCETLRQWSEELQVQLGTDHPTAEVSFELVPLPLLEITLRYPLLEKVRPGRVLER